MSKQQFLRITSAFPMFLAVLAVAWFVGTSVGGQVSPRWDVGTHEQIMDIRPALPGTPRALIESNDCWTGEAPSDVSIPGHVVVSKPGQAPRLAGPVVVGKALDQLFAGEEHGLHIHAFCR